MRILHLNATANWGSTGKIAEGIGNAVKSRGWENFIAYGRYENPGRSVHLRVGNDLDVYRHYALSKIFDREGQGSKNPTRKLIKQIREEIKPDIIHLHNIHDHWLNFPEFFQFLLSIETPMVWTFHDCWAFTGGCGHFVDLNCEEWKKDCQKCKRTGLILNRSRKNLKLKTDLIRGLGDRLRITSVSQWLDSLVGKSLLKELSHEVIHNGIDTKVFKPILSKEIDHKFNIKNKKILLGVSNVWPPYKGFKDYIELSKLLDDNFTIILVGLPEKLMRDLPERIIGLPRTQNTQELVSLYSRADAVLSLSKTETFGLTLVEGLACGTPSIGYASTATNEIISEDIGIKVEPGNIKELKEAVDFLISNKPFSSDICRQTALNKYNQEIQFNKYVDLYEELIESRNRK